MLFTFRKSLSCLLLATLCALPAQAQTSVAEALTEAEADLKSAISSLSKTRAGIAKEKPSITAKFAEVEAELRKKRKLVRIAELSREDRAAELRALETDLNTRSNEATYLAGILKDHALKSQTLAQPGVPALQLEPDALTTKSSDPSAALRARLAVLDSSIDQLEEILGGSSAPMKAADSSGEILAGNAVSLGPISFFISEDKKIAGDIITAKGNSVPKFISQDPEAIAALLSGKSSALQIDPSGGNARAMEDLDGGPLDLFRKGGLWIWPIISLALLSLIFGIYKLFQFSKLREPTDAWVSEILTKLRADDEKGALALATNRNHPASDVMEKLVPLWDKDPDLIEETLYERLMTVQGKASSLLPVIAITAATAPLLGLLGTVSGMIATFNLITLFGSGDPKPLAGGISEALITTLFGLIVAIPALILHAFLSRRSQAIVRSTERLGISFINGLRKGS